MSSIFKLNSSGSDVQALQLALQKAGFRPGEIDGVFGSGTEAAVMAFQQSQGLAADGIVGLDTARALGLASLPSLPSAIPGVTVQVVAKMFPATPLENIKTNLPFVLDALTGVTLTDKAMVLMALSTIRAETESFQPVSEGPSRFNTSPSGNAFDLYDYRKDLGNAGPPDGKNFRGRGFVQLTGRTNYTHYGAMIGKDLAGNPDLANDPTLAAELLACFLKEREDRIREAIGANDLITARRLVNGGSNGLDRFQDAFQIGLKLIPGAPAELAIGAPA